MTISTVAILMPGDMGEGVATALRQSGLAVISSLAGRSEATVARAKAAGIEDAGSLEDVVRRADLVLSILPPEAAAAQAEAVAAAMKASGATPPYADCNAVSPATAKAIGATIRKAGAEFIDGGIIGVNPVKTGGRTRLYVSGPRLDPVMELDGRGFIVRSLGDEPGTASAMKMVYASATKGTFALHAAVLVTAERLGLTEPYLAELEESQPQMKAAMERMVPRIPLDAARWLGEMNEIAATFAAAGVTPKFHEGAADIMRLADRTPIAAETRATVDESRTLRQALEMYAAAVDEGA